MKTWEVMKALEEGIKITRIPHQYEGYYTYEDGVLWFNMKNIKMNGNPKQLFLNDWIEYKENKFAIGDKVINLLSSRLHTIEKVIGDGKYLSANHGTIHQNNLRMATVEEIKLEVKNEKLAKWGRELNEYKVGDVVLYDGKAGIVSSISEGLAYIYESMYAHKFNVITMLCPVELRVD